MRRPRTCAEFRTEDKSEVRLSGDTEVALGRRRST
jgi:hypothetical protein